MIHLHFQKLWLYKLLNNDVITVAKILQVQLIQIRPGPIKSG